MREVMPVRRELGVRTVFNLLGPLTNPAGARRQVLGVYRNRAGGGASPRVLADLGSEHALVVHGATASTRSPPPAPTAVAEVRGGRIARFEVKPEDFGVARARLEDLAGGDIAEQRRRPCCACCAASPGRSRDIAALNAGGRALRRRPGREPRRGRRARAQAVARRRAAGSPSSSALRGLPAA